MRTLARRHLNSPFGFADGLQELEHLIVDPGVAGTASLGRQPTIDAGVVDAEAFGQPSVGESVFDKQRFDLFDFLFVHFVFSARSSMRRHEPACAYMTFRSYFRCAGADATNVATTRPSVVAFGADRVFTLYMNSFRLERIPMYDVNKESYPLRGSRRKKKRCDYKRPSVTPSARDRVFLFHCAT